MFFLFLFFLLLISPSCQILRSLLISGNKCDRIETLTQCEEYSRPVHIAYGVVRRRTGPYVHVHQCTATYAPYVDAGHCGWYIICYLPLLWMGNATHMPHVASVAVRQRSVCERCRRNQRARLQRRNTAPYVVWMALLRARLLIQ